MNKKGQPMLYTIVFVIGALIFTVLLGLFVYGYYVVNESLNINISVGQVNLAEVNAQTFGAFANSFIGIADNLGAAVLVMMCFLMILNAYFFGSKYPKLFLVVDIFILIMAFILSVYISSTYYTYINSSSFLSFYSEKIPKTSAFIVGLPAIVGVVGALILFFSYAAIKKDNPEVNNVLGY